MKTNKLWSIIVMLVLMLGTSTVLSSCFGDDDDNSTSNGTNNSTNNNGNNNSGAPDKTPAGVVAVDLGLESGLKWASCNIGATKPEQYGNYYSWGETEGADEGKVYFEWPRYKYCNNATWMGLTKYTRPDGEKNGSWYSGDTFIGDNKTTLDITGDQIDDVARAKWGGNWRMPTRSEYLELILECDWSWEKVNGISGYRVTSKAPNNKNSIFLPAGGYHRSNYTSGVGSKGYYWSASLGTSSSDLAACLLLDSSKPYLYTDSRYDGLTVRAVCK